MKCPHCDKEYKREDFYNKHLVSVHSDIEPNATQLPDRPADKPMEDETVSGSPTADIDQGPVGKPEENTEQPTPIILPTQPETSIDPTSDIDAEIEAKKLKLKELDDQITGKVSYVPGEIRAVIDDVLGTEFEAEVNTRSDMPVFELTIYVPDEYSSLPKEEKEMIGGRDKRFIVIKNNEGVDGTRNYCKLVKQNIKQNMEERIKQPS